MWKRLEDSEERLVFDLPPTTTLLDTVDVVSDVRLRLQHAEGLARVCAAAMHEQDLEEDDLRHALALLYDYLRALRWGLARWRVGMLPADVPRPAVDAEGPTDA